MSKMDWMPYPGNLPEKDGNYLVSIGSYVTIAEFNKHTKQYDAQGVKYLGPAWHDVQEGGMYSGVTAFMEKPKPYEGA